MQRWRYKAVMIRDLALSEAKLNAEGEKGWELVSVCMADPTTARAFFKMTADLHDALGHAVVEVDHSHSHDAHAVPAI